MFHKKTIKDIDIQGKWVLLRADYNVPLKDGVITDDYRIKKSLPTIQFLTERNCKVVVCSHLGRPKGIDPALSLKPVAQHLGKLLGREVWFSQNAVGPESRQLIKDMPHGDVLLLENLRFYPEEKANDATFAAQLAEHMDVFVQDAFGVVHRADASTDAVTHYLPSVAGLLVEAEVDKISEVIEQPERPLMTLIGGAKISDKIDLLRRFIDTADVVAVGGAMANTFLAAEGVEIGKSLYEPNDIPLAKEIMKKARAKAKDGKFVFYIPQDGVVSKSTDSKTATRIADWGTHVIADIEHYPKVPPKSSSVVLKSEMILDIGPFSGAFIAGSMQLAKTVVWNGAMGVTEVTGLQSKIGPYSHGTELVMEAMLGQFGNRPKTVVGGGDTVGYVEDRQLTEHFYYVSTGGGASMELMSGKKLPGVEALQDK